MRIGIFGGSFDPVHYGHLWVAESMREHLQLDAVHFVPANISPLKPGANPATNLQRMDMLKLAIGGYLPFVIDDRELRRGGISYTVDTLRELSQEFPEAELFFILGADSFNDFDRWREPQEVCRLALPAVVSRGGDPPPDWSVLARYIDADRLEQAKHAALLTPLIEVSSRDLRRRWNAGLSIRFRLPLPVEVYIQHQQLYR